MSARLFNAFWILIFFNLQGAYAQLKSYESWEKTGDSLFQNHDYEQSALSYSNAFKINGWRGAIADRLKSADAWAMAGRPDSSYFQLNKIIFLTNYKDLEKLQTDPFLKSLHKDNQWKDLLRIVVSRKNKFDSLFNRSLATKLEQIYEDDQKYRELGDWKMILQKDSVNQKEVIEILKKYGWLSEFVVGEKGADALFLVIQHADIKIQEIYLPMLRKAVQNGDAKPSDLALLEDRVLMRQNKKQLYGSQIRKDKKGNWIIHPIEDAANVDKRRAEMGLGPIAIYVSRFGLKWNLEEHVKLNVSD